ncbi:MAG: TetR/AcrR family transcriptional regulator [Lachnospiraceae bacterium]|nr:TetR/AcrR family transcriptional regulator [Lachnospiraceae bacterium]
MNSADHPSAVRSRTKIAEALLGLMEKYPYNEITVKQIILETDLVRKTFYRNFSSKDEVLRYIMKKALSDYFSVINSGKVDVLKNIFMFADRNRRLLILLDKNNMLYIALQCMNELLPVFRDSELSEANPFTPLFEGLDSDYLIALNTGAVWNVISLWVHRGMKDKPAHVEKTVRQYIERLRAK